MEDYKKALAATNWWLDKMKVQCQKMYPDKVVCNDSEIVITDTYLSEGFSRFSSILFKNILFTLQTHNHLSLTCCCFMPARDLRRLANEASISTSFFPEYASMQIFENSVKVSVFGENLRSLCVPEE